jgi:hypothetical protein
MQLQLNATEVRGQVQMNDCAHTRDIARARTRTNNGGPCAWNDSTCDP